MRVHLSTDLRKKHNTRTTQVRVGDKVQIMRGQFTKREGKVEKVDLKREKVYITGIEKIKKNGTKFLVSLSPSNLMIMELILKDKKRKLKLSPAAVEKPVEKAEGKNTKEKTSK